MEVKAGYKRTEVGVIPVEWEVATIGQLIETQFILGHLDGNHGELYPRSHEFKPHGVPYIGANDFDEGNVTFDRCKFLSEERAALFRKGVARDGDVLFAHNATVGPVALLRTNVPFVILSTTATYFRCNPEKLDNVYLKGTLQSKPFVKQYQAVMAQSTRFQVPITAQRKLSLVVPPLPEQSAIAEALSDVDALLGALDRLIAKKRDLKQAAMQQLLTGQTRLPGFASAKSQFKKSEIGMLPDDWEVERVRQLATIKTGSRNTQDRIEDGAYPFFVRSSTIERINSYSFDGEAVLTAGDGVGTGKVFHYINGKFDIHQRVYKISDFSSRLVGRFFFLVFSTRFYDRIMSMTAKSSVDSVRMEMIADMLIPLPSASEQSAIAAVLTDMDSELAALEQRWEKTRALKQGMMQELLTGRTRLV